LALAPPLKQGLNNKIIIKFMSEKTGQIGCWIFLISLGIWFLMVGIRVFFIPLLEMIK
jgi:hypothetical protein